MAKTGLDKTLILSYTNSKVSGYSTNKEKGSLLPLTRLHRDSRMRTQLIGKFENNLDIQIFLEQVLTQVPNTEFNLGFTGTGFYIDSNSREILDIASKWWNGEYAE